MWSKMLLYAKRNFFKKREFKIKIRDRWFGGWKLAALINYQLLGNYQELSCEILYFIMWNCNYVKE